MITSIHEDIDDGFLRFAFIAYFEAISFARAGAEACPYAEDLDRVASFSSVAPFCVGEDLDSIVQITRVNASSDARWNVERVGRKPKA
jgi:hypothetical protein